VAGWDGVDVGRGRAGLGADGLGVDGLGALAASTAEISALAALRAPNPNARPKRTESIGAV